jgi:DNA-binding MarR family transcriptional regulator
MTGSPDAGEPCPWLGLDASGHGLAVRDFVTARINAAAQALNRSSERRYLRRFDLTVPEWRMLSILAALGPCSARDVVGQVSIDKALISRTIKRLQARDFLEVRSNPDDRRTSKIELSAQGAAMYRKLLPFARRRQASLIEDLTGAERQALWSALEKLRRTAETLNQEER